MLAAFDLYSALQAQRLKERDEQIIVAFFRASDSSVGEAALESEFERLAEPHGAYDGERVEALREA